MKNIYIMLILVTLIWAEEPLIKLDISDSYEAVVSLEQKTIKVMDRVSKKVLISQKISFSGAKRSTITQKSDIFMVDDVPLLHFADFNFDGYGDILVYASGSVDGTVQNTLYLYKDNSFVKDETLPHFNLNAWGIYKADQKSKRVTISTLCESYRDIGCHTVFGYLNGKFEETEWIQAFDDYYEPYYTLIKHTKEAINGRKRISEIKYIVNKERKDFEAEFAFELPNQKRVYLLLDEESTEMTLSFFYTDMSNVAIEAFISGKSEKSYTLNTTNPEKTTLKFQTENTSYTIYQKYRGKKIKEVGIIISKHGKSKKYIGLLSSRIGDLRRLNRDIVCITRRKK